jgi:hypothetical protein
MLPLQSSACVACGGPLPNTDQPVVVCSFCKTSYRTGLKVQPKRQHQKPSIGDLILGTDFRNKSVPGWRLYNEDHLDFRLSVGMRPELWATFKTAGNYQRLIGTPGPLYDFDASVNLRFIKGAYDKARAGFELRLWDVGNYLIQISPQATFSVGYHIDSEWGEHLANWSEHSALKKGWGELNRVRVVARGDQLRVYLNGVMAASLRDDRYRMGRLLVVAAPMGVETTVAISDLQIREAFAV